MIGFTYIPAGGASTSVVTTPGIQATISATTPTAPQVDTLVFKDIAGPTAIAPFGLADQVTVAWTGTGVLSGKSVTVAVPNTGTAATDATSLATSLQTAINLLTANVYSVASVGSPFSSYTITAPAATLSGTPAAGTYSTSAFTLLVDGVLANATDVAADVTLGDTVVYQAPDASTSKVRSLSLTNANYSGTVNPAATDATSAVDVFAAGSSTVALPAIDYVSFPNNGMSGTPVYKVNGVTKLVADFKIALGGIHSGALTGTIVVTGGVNPTFALTTAIA